jgi:hypothetical protein
MTQESLNLIDSDLVLRGPHVVDPSQGLSEVLDVAVRAGTVAALGRPLAVSPRNA